MSDAAHCTDPSYGWANNINNEDPCRLASLLCFPSLQGLPALLPSEKYSPQKLLQGAGSLPCICSSVIYALSSACADCQLQDWDSLNLWEDDCAFSLQTAMSLQSPPDGALTNDSIPSWASSFSSNSPNNLTYSRTLAEAIALGTPPAQSGLPPPTETGTDSSSTSTSTETSVPISAAKKSNLKIGPLVGGIIGGLVLFVALMVLIFYVLKRRRRSKIPPSQLYKAEAAQGFESPMLHRRSESGFGMYHDSHSHSHSNSQSMSPKMSADDPYHANIRSQTPEISYTSSSPR
ncbi:hypothetical protein C8J56DRAFT_959150 [Mycena floridula]|nr:hypothetical protein C8J56DRAFT_959150 [Mycena floridula]